MAKKLFKDSNNKNVRYKVVSEITKTLNKKGEIKGNKKERKVNKGRCVHFRYNHKGQLKSKTINNHDGTVTCLMCGHRFRTKPYSKDELKEVSEPLIEAADQISYISVFYRMDPGTVDFLSKMKSYVKQFPKIGNKVTKISVKKSAVKKKKKKGNSKGSSSQYGSWSSAKRI